MYQVKIYAVGKAKESWLDEALNEYKKRLTKDMAIKWHLVKDDADLEKSLQKQQSVICLDPGGIHLSSPEFATFLTQEFIQQGSKLSFVIGGPEGLSQAILSKASHQLSFSKLTFTNQIARLILLEQLYRAIQIEKGTRYHK